MMLKNSITRRTAPAPAAAATLAVPAQGAIDQTSGTRELVAAVTRHRAAHDAFNPIHDAAEMRRLATLRGRDSYSKANVRFESFVGTAA